ncbi:LacI family DNA-binding transcriptional regulator [Raineyella fluvialis]|uniref:LacI family DNA-binding transcriptional regulator n=1 Tax=Raineyella fluvialis TaxID=2662261 RepID=A0A5Q2F8K4_9ACTN|nr:LacI family DNA-binding transcriptional regulator [Raineyella fluvialis]QGF22998.1 LacI family DNA-binding transcriptional regulator [Raineyella fluvialis]
MTERTDGATIRDVAEKAGVSKSLVSLVLRGDPHVSDERRRAVYRAMADLGYRPNHAARALSSSRSGIVGVLLNDLRNPWFAELLDGLTTTLHAAGLTPVLSESVTVRRAGGDAVQSLTGLGVDGLVVVGATPDAAALTEASALFPVVLAGARQPRLPGGDVAVDDDLTGARMATEHLIGLGHRRIAHLRGPGEEGALRLQGYRRAMLAAGLDPDRYAEAGGMSEDSGYASTRRLLTREDAPTAIFAFNDISAVGALSAAADAGINVPDGLSLVGYDDTYLARIRHISLSSVDNGNYAVGVQAGRLLIARLDDPSRDARVVEVATTLHVRGSTAPPRRAPLP